MMYLVNAFVAGATAVELRNLAVVAGNKIEMNGHGLSNGTIVKASAAITAGVAANKLYVVDSATTNDFQLKTFKGSDATGETAVEMAAVTTEVGTSFQKYGSKKCKITAVDEATDKVSCENASFAVTDKLLYYCTANTGDDGCKLDAAGSLAPNTIVYAGAVDATSFVVSATAPTGTTPGTAHPFVGAANAAIADKNWLLKEDSTIIYPTAPKTVLSTGKTWKLDTNEGFCGDEACKIIGGEFYYYTQTGTKTDGLTDKTVYQAVIENATPYKFTLKTATHGDNLTAGTTAVDVKAAGAGNTYTKIATHRLIENCDNTGNKCKVKGDNTVTTAVNFAADKVVMFYCTSATATDCDYKIADQANGKTYKVKAATNDTAGTAFTEVTLKGNDSAAADVAVSADSGALTKGFFLIMAQKGTGDAATDDKTVFPPAAAAGGSAARSFAMLGSAFAMATAFLFA